MPEWVNVGDVPGLKVLPVSSDDGRNCRKRRSAGEVSTIDFSSTHELYCRAVSSSVFAFRTTSCSQVCVYRRRPGMRLCSGVRHSAAMAFSLLAQIPVSVLTTSV